MNKVLPDHLGGHMNKTHTDRATFLYLMKKYNVKNMVDIGCGLGDMVRVAQDRGIDAIGVDGDFTLVEHWNSMNIPVVLHDFNTGVPNLPENFQKIDMVWCVEFLEHVHEQYIPNFMEIFSRANIVIMTAAPPGHGGHHHVNEQPSEYWIEKFSEVGLIYDQYESLHIRKNSVMKKPFMQRNGMLFKKEGLYD